MMLRVGESVPEDALEGKSAVPTSGIHVGRKDLEEIGRKVHPKIKDDLMTLKVEEKVLESVFAFETDIIEG